MRAILVFCLITAAAAQYDYSPQEEVVQVAAQIQSQPIQQQPIQQQPIQQQPIQQQPIPQPQPVPQIIQQAEFNKEFYSYSAPESEFDDGGSHDHVSNSIKKSLRVVFIKGPEMSGLENAALQFAKSSSDDRTAIYVLQKQADVGDLANKLAQTHSNNNNRPEVHFVKYRTQADADNAQRTIQSQYDSLPGPSSNHNAGSAPVLDFASKPSSSGSYSSPQSAYLPPGRRF